MKTKIKNSILLIAILLSTPILCQGPWFTAGNTLGTFNYLGSVAGNNVPVRMGTNGFDRMLIDGGTGTLNSGRIAMGNNLPSGFLPQARLHLHQTGALGNNEPLIRFTTTATNTTNLDGFTIGNQTGPIGPFGDVKLDQYETAPLIISAPNGNPSSPNLLPYEWFRLENGKIFLAHPAAPNRYTDGYIGLNKANPRSHIEMNTPAFTGGEEFFLAKPDDIYDPPASNIPALNVQMGMMNLTANNNELLPGVFGNINQSAQAGSALAMLGCIPNAQDVSSNQTPIMRFSVGKNWLLNANIPFPVGSIPPTATVVTRPLFAWENGSTMMYMASNGRLRIGYSLGLGNPALPYQRPNNRVEITAAAIDPYYDPNGNPIGNPNISGLNFGSASGLRFTFLTSRDLVIAPNATNQIDPSKVLSVDVNGDVVAIYPALGAPCSNTAQIAAQTFTSSRAVNQGTFNMEWRGQGRNGFGTNNCTVGNRVEITGLTSFSATLGGNSGLRFTNMTSTTTAITNPTNKVLSVNSNGDVILVTDQSGTATATGSIAAQNGLTLVGTNTVELGGTLLHQTNIDFNGSAITYSNNPSGTITHIQGANGGTYSRAFGAHGLSGTPEVNFYEEAFATSPNASFGRDLYVAAVSPTVANFDFVGERVSANINITSPPIASVALNGNVTGIWSKAQNTGSNAKSNYAFKAEAFGAGPVRPGLTPINAGYIAGATGSSNNYGFYAEMVNAAAANEDIGVKALMQANASSTNVIGGDFSTLRGVNAYGVRAFAQGGTSTNFGVWGKALAGGTLNNIAIYGEVNSSVSTPTPGPGTFAGYFTGDVVRTGNDNFSSDQNLKQNIDSISNAIGVIKQLKPKTFDYKQSSYPSMSLPGGKQYGLLAQDVQTILPELVNTITHPAKLDSLGNIVVPSFNYLSLEYQQLIPFLIRGMQQQQRTIEKQDSVMQQMQSQISSLTSSVTSCCSSSAVRATTPAEQNQLTVNLSDKDIIVLNQNVPNPFAEQTTITYNVPEKYGYAQMIFSTIDGRILKTVDITKKGRGTITVYSNDLSSGMYSYSLVVDGKTFDTKKMMKSE